MQFFHDLVCWSKSWKHFQFQMSSNGFPNLTHKVTTVRMNLIDQFLRYGKVQRHRCQSSKWLFYFQKTVSYCIQPSVFDISVFEFCDVSGFPKNCHLKYDNAKNITRKYRYWRLSKSNRNHHFVLNNNYYVGKSKVQKGLPLEAKPCVERFLVGILE